VKTKKHLQALLTLGIVMLLTVVHLSRLMALGRFLTLRSMSAFRGKVDIGPASQKCPLVTKADQNALGYLWSAPLTIVSEAVTVMVGRVEFSAATHADWQA